MTPQTFVVGRQEAEKTVSAFLRTRLNLPWSKIKTLVESGQIRVAGQKVVDPAHRLRLGKSVQVMGQTSSPPPASVKKKSAAKAETPVYEGPLPTIIYSDDTLVVVNKPADLTTMRHPEEAEEFGPRGKAYLPTTLADLLPAMLGRPGKPLKAVHRLDRDTTGLVVFARNKTGEKHLTDQFKAHSIERRYLALVRGTPTKSRLESILVRDRGDGRRGTGDDATGQRAITHVMPVEQFGEFALVECRLETGRTHQVRIHLGEAGWPLCGEKIYDRPLHAGPIKDGSGAKRPMLHAARLGLTHPVTEERLLWQSDLPEDFLSSLTRLRNRKSSTTASE